jgi:Xaa-Pro aminopeptidase
MKEEVYGAIKKDVTIHLADDIIQELAREKTEKEIEIVRKAGKLGDVGFEAFLEHARGGIREYELVAEMEYAMRSAGADEVFILLSSGKHNFAMHGATDRRLQKGDIVIGEITPVCDGQFLQVCRTVVLGKPSPVLTEKYDLLVRALEESLKTIKAGAPASMMSIVMNKIISEAGYGEYCRPPHMRARGHGFGSGSIAPGAAIDDHIKVNLERHQVIVVHPNQYIPETGYLSCGETVMVTDGGFERLANTQTKLYTKEG